MALKQASDNGAALLSKLRTSTQFDEYISAFAVVIIKIEPLIKNSTVNFAYSSG